MDFRQLEYFVTAADRQSLSGAAEALYTSQPHVSVVIRALERELGTVLFDRTPQGVRLTESGRKIYDYAVKALTEQRLMTDAAGRKGIRRLSVVTAPSSNMAALFAEFYRTHDNGSCHYRFFEGGAESVLQQVASGDADLGFAFISDARRAAFQRMLEQQRLLFLPLLETDVVLYAGRYSRLSAAEAVSREELACQRFIQNEDDFFSISDLLNADRQFRPLQPECVIRTNSDHVMLQMLQNTDLCNLGSYWLKDSYNQYGFRRIAIDGYSGKIHFGCVTGPGRELSAAAEQFLAYVRRAIDKETLAEG